jgi:hypothetical protein
MMQIMNDESAFDALQHYLVRVIAEDVRDALRLAAASGATMEEAVQAITFGVATIIDGSRHMTHDDEPVIPVLMFGLLDEDENITDVISSGEPSWMRDYAVEVARDAVQG